MKEFFKGLHDWARALRLIRRRRLWPALLAPGIFSLLWLPAALWGCVAGAQRLSEHMREHWLPNWAWMDYVAAIASAIAFLLALMAGFLVFRAVLMILFAPLFGWLSEKTEFIESGRTPPDFSASGMLFEFVRAILMGALTVFAAIGSLLFFWLFAFAPVIGPPVSAIGAPLSQMLLAGVDFVDPALERRRLSAAASIRFALSHKARLAGVGCGFMLMLALPAVGWFLAPGCGVVAGTLAVCDLDKSARKPH